MSRSANLASFAKTLDGAAPFVVNGSLTVTNLTVTSGTLTVNSFSSNTITANGSLGSNGQVLKSNGTSVYWGSAGSNTGVIYTYGVILGRG